ncbi:MAG: hypothetical protein JRG68_04855 [Deltaproteobacteria bacterium]|nr:hypothetical protein [Deltaproteobacteria bacterium]MBW2100084.1 hypothetical protein [Deltaproteobacteria bacterium]
MRAVLNVNLNEIDESLLKIIEELLLKNAEVVIRKESVKLEEYDKSIPLDKVMGAFEKADYSNEFLEDLKEGLETSTVYSEKDEDNTVKKSDKEIS